MQLQPLLFLGSGLGMMLTAALAWAIWRRRRVPRVFWVWGAVAWIASVALKFGWAVPMNPRVARWLLAAFPPPVSHPLLWIYVGLLTGVFECGLSLAVIWYVRHLREASWAQAVGFGIAFGGTEALLLGINSVASAASAMARSLPPGAFPPGYGPAWALAPIVERAFTIPIHVLAAVLIFYSVRTRAFRWFWVSFAYKTGVDALAAFARISYGIYDLRRLWTIEAVVVLIGLGSLWATARLRQRWPNGSRSRVGHLEEPPPPPAE